MTERRARVGSFIDRHATILTIIAMAVLVLVPTKIAYDASGNATDAGNTATHAAHKASNAVARLESERRQRIYDQNGIDRYFCGKSAAIEKVLTLLLTASLNVKATGELTESQLNARSVFERVLAELSEAPKCEVLIPAPPKPKPGESRKRGASAEAQAESHPEEAAQQLAPPASTPPTSTEGTHQPKPSPPHGGGGGNGGETGGHEHKPPTSPSEGGTSPPPTGTQETAPPAQESTGTASQGSPPAETPAAETPPPSQGKSGLIPSTIESIEGVVGCLGKADLACTLGEVVGQP